MSDVLNGETTKLQAVVGEIRIEAHQLRLYASQLPGADKLKEQIEQSEQRLEFLMQELWTPTQVRAIRIRRYIEFAYPAAIFIGAMFLWFAWTAVGHM